MTLAESLRGVSRVYLDTSAFLHYGEANLTSVAVLSRLFGMIRAGEIIASTSTITHAEILTVDEAKQIAYDALLGIVEQVPVDVTIGKRAGLLRQTYGLATPDALHVATALVSECGAIVTGDAADFGRVSGEVRVLIPARLTR